VLRAGERRRAAGQSRFHDRPGDRDAEAGVGLPPDGRERRGHPAIARGIPDTAELLIGGLTVARKTPNGR